MASKLNKTDKKQHIQVFTRVRPMTFRECKSPIVLEVCGSREVKVRDKAQTKTFSFDYVFGPDSRQVDVYKTVVQPYICEVLQGYNCTVFAYGQTGTGKTYTMIGDKPGNDQVSWEQDPCAGIIPRTLSHLFDQLKLGAEEYTVRVSFLEIYNEELCDLLVPSSSEDGKTLRLFEDTVKKGSVIVSGLEERTVMNKNDVYNILDLGTVRRQTASTLMNSQSSRSHTIFTITVHIKDTTPEGEEFIKTGKLNLVDLAGSENIGRSGAVDMRAREAGNINQSLLTLGRVITALVERTPHIPYRESKLTRILRDSLGGRTKTSIIATVSPILVNLDETLSTLDYAHRAKNITNKPEINQKTSKRVLLKEYTEEIERMRRDLIATRDKHGIYLAPDNYNQMINEKDQLNKELVQKIECIRAMEQELSKKEAILVNLNMDLTYTKQELDETVSKLEERERVLASLASDLQTTKQVLTATMDKLRDKEVKCEKFEGLLHNLTAQATAILKVAEEATTDTKKLQDKIERTKQVEEMNQQSCHQFKNNFEMILKKMSEKIVTVKESQEEEHMYQTENLVNVLECVNRQRRQCVQAGDSISSIISQVTRTCLDNVTSQMSTFEKQMLAEEETLTETMKTHEEQTANNRSMCQTAFDVMKKNFVMFEQLVVKNIDTCLKQDELLRATWQDLGKLSSDVNNIPAILEQFRQTMSQEVDKINNSISSIQNNYQQVSLYRNVVNNTCQDQMLPLISELAEHETQLETKVESMLNESSQFADKLTNDVKTRNKTKLCDVDKEVENTSRQLRTMEESGVKDVTSYITNELRDIDTTINTISLYKETQQGLLEDVSNACTELKNELNDRCKETDNFFKQGLGQVIPTGTTPQRKNFDYPKKLVVNSPRTQMLLKQRDSVNSKKLNMSFEEMKELEDTLLAEGSTLEEEDSTEELLNKTNNSTNSASNNIKMNGTHSTTNGNI